MSSHSDSQPAQLTGRLPKYPRDGRRSLWLAVVALAGATIASLIVGITIAPMQAAHGQYFTDTPFAYQLFVYALGATMILWTILGIASLVTGIRSLMREPEKRLAIWGIALSIASPFVALSVLIATMLMATLAL